MRDRARRAVDHHQPARVAPLERRLRDQLGREIEVVVGGAEAERHRVKIAGSVRRAVKLAIAVDAPPYQR